MKKIAIVTLNGYFNYGNRLQNYALQEILTSFGFHVKTLKIDRNLRKERIKSPLRKIKRLISNPVNYMFEKKRQNIFMDFTNTYITELKETYRLDDDLSLINSKFDHFVVGSDQVWNPSMNKKSSIYFLQFADNNKRIAYSPSIGVAELSSETEELYKKWIEEIKFLSIREKEGADLIKSITNLDAEVLVDPTMLLTKDEWISISKGAMDEQKKFLLTYFLGGIPTEHEERINKLAATNNLKIINLGDIKERDTYQTGPSEFIDYINKCSIFCTDSFHGVVFSILLEKPFIVYERVGNSSMYSRITTLLKKFQLSSREIKNMDFNEDVLKIDYSHVSSILDMERKKSIAFLKNALSSNDSIKNDE